jgi:hypothetical protein
MDAYQTLRHYAHAERWPLDTVLLVTSGYLAECVPGAAEASQVAEAALAFAEKSKLPPEALIMSLAGVIDLHAGKPGGKLAPPLAQFLADFAKSLQAQQPPPAQISRDPRVKAINVVVTSAQTRQVQEWLKSPASHKATPGTVLASFSGVCETEPLMSAHLAIVAGPGQPSASVVVQLRHGRTVMAQLDEQYLAGDYTLVCESGTYVVKLTPF